MPSPSGRTLQPHQLIRLLSPPHAKFINKIHSAANFCTVEFTAPKAPQLPPDRQITKPQYACGKGPTANHAKASALAEAAERFSIIFQGTEELIHAPFSAVNKFAVSPETIQQFSSSQYTNRGLGHHAPYHFPWIPPPCPVDVPIYWYPAWSATKDKTILLPAQHSFMAGPGDTRFVRADTNGCAAGGSIEEAFIFGLLELIERDAIAIWWANRIIRRPVELPRNSEARRLAAELQNGGRNLTLIDISTDLPISVMAAVSWSPKTNSQLGLAFGAHWNPNRAALRALRELLQVHQNHRHSPANYQRGSMEFAQMLWLQRATLDSDPHLRPAGEPIVLNKSSETAELSPIDRLKELLSIARTAKLNILLQDFTRPEIRLPVVRVTCPQLCSPWGRFALRRLYTLPVKMGWRKRALKESELNPVPFAM